MRAALTPIRAIERIIGLTLSWGLLGVVLLQVVDRFLFGGGLQLAWTEEIARITLVWYAFWGAILVHGDGSHIRLEFLESALPPGPRRALALVIECVVVVFLAVVMVAAFHYTWHEWDFHLPATGLRRSVFVLAVAVSSAMMLVDSVLVLVSGRAGRSTSAAGGAGAG